MLLSLGWVLFNDPLFSMVGCEILSTFKVYAGLFLLACASVALRLFVICVYGFWDWMVLMKLNLLVRSWPLRSLLDSSILPTLNLASSFCMNEMEVDVCFKVFLAGDGPCSEKKDPLARGSVARYVAFSGFFFTYVSFLGDWLGCFCMAILMSSLLKYCL